MQVGVGGKEEEGGGSFRSGHGSHDYADCRLQDSAEKVQTNSTEQIGRSSRCLDLSRAVRHILQ